ncbi:hypothetical protein ABZ891_18055 [Streptomyces sp. NPDC047023]|uniref:hypothetical protein n=1 Tax=Streptomyces sp. NPDC047023 TaxID=3155139 RepID=UPI0033F6C3D2
MERHGDVPRRDTPWGRQPDICVRPFGAGRLMADLHLTFSDIGAFEVYALLVDLAGPARAHLGTDQLLVFFYSKGVEKARGFRTGLPNSILASWSRGANLSADALGEDGLPIPLVVDSQRLRMSWLERHQQPVAHTERTLANEYLARNRGNLAEYQKVVADVLEEQLAGARAAQVMRVLTAADVAEARQRPEAVARRHGLETATLQKLLAGELDTVLGGCTDHLASPHSPAGEPYRAAFLLCLSCPCARATPAGAGTQAVGRSVGPGARCGTPRSDQGALRISRGPPIAPGRIGPHSPRCPRPYWPGRTC